MFANHFKRLMYDKMEIDSESKSKEPKMKENPHFGIFPLVGGIPSHIFCEVLHVMPQQILVRYQWKETTYKGLLWNFTNR